MIYIVVHGYDDDDKLVGNDTLVTRSIHKNIVGQGKLLDHHLVNVMVVMLVMLVMLFMVMIMVFTC